MKQDFSRREILLAGSGVALGGLGLAGLSLNARRPSSTESGAIAADPLSDLPGSRGTHGWLNPDIEAEIRANFLKPASDPTRQTAQEARPNPGASRRIEGYTDATSVNTGENVTLRVSSSMGSYLVSFLRIGWYGGAGAREVFRSNPIGGSPQPKPQPDSDGLIACAWPSALTVSTNGWKSGYYVAALIPTSSGVAESYVPFVVRDDESTAPILVQVAFTTYQAYNTWGGNDMYGGTNGLRANKVSFDRPYDLYGGTQFLFSGDFQMICWLERYGYAVTYVANEDTHLRPWLMNGRKLFLVAHHDEYWTQSMRNNVKSWMSSNKSLAFLSANNIYWRVRFEPNSSGAPNRIMACYKIGSTDPNQQETTIRYVGLGQSEIEIQGVEFAGNGTLIPDWIVANSRHWMYANTGVVNGTRIDGLVGYEWDRYLPSAPAGTEILSASPAVSDYDGLQTQNAVIRETSNGSVVFAAGAIAFASFLGGPVAPAEEPVVSQMMVNLLNRIGVLPSEEEESDVTTTTTTTTPPISTGRSAATPANANGSGNARVGAPGAASVESAARRPASSG